MSFINIQTDNMSRQFRNASTYLDNWVYVPGNTITGDWKKPMAFRSVEDFQKTCGTVSPANSITYEYVAGLLSAGLPVLFRRIAYVGQDSVTDDIIERFEENTLVGGETAPVGVKRARFYSKVAASGSPSGTGEEDKKLYKVVEKYGGTFGNSIYYTIKKEGTSYYYIEIYVDKILNQRVRFATIPADVTDNHIEEMRILIDGLKSVELNLVNIVVYEDDPSEFQFIPVDRQQLSGGVDMDNDLVLNEIPQTLEFIKDKVLFQPKFVTMGGYTDDNTSALNSVGNQILAFTKARQDCRAVLDLQLGIAPTFQQTAADGYSYQQGSDSEPIPSGCVFAPWQYMQVANKQMWMPPSYAYLTVVGGDLSKGKKAYTPKAGIATGRVGNIIKPEFEIGSTLAEQWQQDGEVNINPIMKLQSGNYVIAGNSTLLKTSIDGNELNAFSESSADLTIIEIRRFVYNLATELQYQYNGVEAFETFSLRTAKFLNTMASEGAVTDYDIINISTDEDPRTLKVQLDVYLTPTIKKIEIYLNVAYGSIEVSTGGVK